MHMYVSGYAEAGVCVRGRGVVRPTAMFRSYWLNACGSTSYEQWFSVGSKFIGLQARDPEGRKGDAGRATGGRSEGVA